MSPSQFRQVTSDTDGHNGMLNFFSGTFPPRARDVPGTTGGQLASVGVQHSEEAGHAAERRLRPAARDAERFASLVVLLPALLRDASLFLNEASRESTPRREASTPRKGSGVLGAIVGVPTSLPTRSMAPRCDLRTASAQSESSIAAAREVLPEQQGSAVALRLVCVLRHTYSTRAVG